jgi:hypothetical protein
MNMRFSTEAANADVLGEDTPDAAAEGLSAGVGADGTPREPKAQPQARSQAKPDGGADTKPNKDAAGLMQDSEAGKP